MEVSIREGQKKPEMHGYNFNWQCLRKCHSKHKRLTYLKCPKLHSFETTRASNLDFISFVSNDLFS